jgi:hypothetical protein
MKKTLNIDKEILRQAKVACGAATDTKTAYGDMHRVPPVSHAKVVEFVRTHRLHGRGIGWVDAHLSASALVAKTALWTADERLAHLASELGVGYEPTST